MLFRSFRATTGFYEDRLTTVTDSDDVVSESGYHSALFDNGSWSNLQGSIVFRRYYASLLMSVYQALHSTLAEREGWKPRRCRAEPADRPATWPCSPGKFVCTILCGRLDLSWTTAGIHTRLLKPSLPLPRSFRCVDAYRSYSPASGPMLHTFSSDFLCFFPVKAHADPSDFAVCSIVHCYCQTCPSVALSSNEEFDNGSAVSLIHGSG